MMIIYKYIYKDNEVNGKWQLSYMNDIIEVVIGNKWTP